MTSFRQSRIGLTTGILLFGMLGCPAFAQAAGITISPVVIEVNSAGRAAAITLTNDSSSALTFQAATMVWLQVNGVDQNEPTDDLLVVPPIVEVQPGNSQIVRVALRSPATSPVERTYRLVLEDISESLAPASGDTTIAFRFNHNLPVLVAPSGKIVTTVKWMPCTPDAGAPGAADRPAETATGPSVNPQACVRLRNTGNRRVKVQTLTLTGEGWQQAVPLKEGENLLAGSERQWHIPTQAGQTGALRSVLVHTARGETLSAEPVGF